MGNFKEEIIFQGAVNMQYQGIGSALGHNKGGQLTLTNKNLIFKAHALNIGQKEYLVPLQDIKFAQDTFHVLTPTPNMIKVELQSGEVYKFVVKGKEKDTWKNLILEYAQKARVDIDATNAVNEATNGQTKKYAEKAKETAKGFTDDVKQVAKDKDTSNFFTKNKYRNVKIIAVVLIAVFLLSSLLGEDKRRKNGKKYCIGNIF